MSARIIPRETGPDGLSTPTSDLQIKTEKDLQQVYSATPKPLTLQRMRHFNWLKPLIFQGLPAGYKSQDASQPWLLFWIVQSFQLMGAGLDPQTKQRAIDTIMKCQHPDGGFGGGPRQAPGLLPTYAAISALACVGRPGPGGGWDDIDRQKMYKFFISLKQPDGSFLVSKNAEVDIRGVYALLVVATLLDLITPELIAGTASFIASTQTYEGGFASSSAPIYISDDILLEEPRPSLGEAHGGYAGCAIASWVMLQPTMLPEQFKQLDVPKFLRWLVWMQGEEEDIGGFRGRSNKLVDNCYSWWCGGSLAVVESLLNTGDEPEEEPTEEPVNVDDEWVDTEWWLYNNKALQEYVLGVGQDNAGGLRDKPGKRPDIYHTFYSLAGLSTAQHRVYRSNKELEKLKETWQNSTPFIPTSSTSSESEADIQSRRKLIWAYGRSWKEDEGSHRYVGSSNNRVNATHPVTTLLVSQNNAMLDHFYGQTVAAKTS
ncbi:terpenoid cyclases/Protein prenyltransferase [Serendipita vermifera]|nr:terpenoid cyclases/Protein prenyltransferase [Serendipita vermifera]